MADEITQQTSGDLSGKSFGQYDILDQLGQGGMATVYRAHQRSIGRTVAIKVMPPYFVHESTFMQRFEREVRVIAELQHPRVLPVYDYGQIEGLPYIVMAYMPGGTLADRVKQGPLPLEEIVRLVRQIAEGLDHAHRKGVIHRDFKPSNVLLDEHGNAYLADFGIAKISEATVQLTGSGVVGTPAYMAPEMATGDVVTPAVDIYALGITLFQMLTGRLPFRGETPLSVMMAHASEPVPDVRELRPDLPAGVSHVVMRALAKNPADRYPTAGEMASDLEKAAQGQAVAEPPTARPISPTLRPMEAAPTPPSAPPTAPVWQPVPERPTVPSAPPAPLPSEEKRGGCRWGLAATIGAVVVLLMVCGGGFILLGGMAMLSSATPIPPTDTPLPPLPSPAASPTVPSAGGPAEGYADLLLRNESQKAVCYVQISLSDSDTWGEDWLGEDQVIANGGSFLFQGIPAGKYDYRALDCDQSVMSVHYGVQLAGSMSWTVRDPTSTLTVINSSSYQVCGLYASAVEDTVWGVNLFAEGRVLENGQQQTVSVAPGTYDLRAEGCDGTSYWELQEVVIETAFEWTLTD